MATQMQAPPTPVTQMAGDGSIPDGSLYGLPGVTVFSEQVENNSGISTTLQNGAQTPAQFPSNFKQTDVVYGWRMRTVVTQTNTGGTFSALSTYFPYNFIANLALNVQNQFDTLSYLNGIDAAIFQALRPMQQNAWPANWVDQNTIANAYSGQTYQVTATNYTQDSSSVAFDLDLLPGIKFDRYYDLQENGQLIRQKAQGIKTFVSPLMMAGTNRIIQPRVTFSQIYTTSGNGDIAPYEYTVAPTSTVSAALNFRRYISYQPQSSKDAPLLWNWQYSRQTIRGSLSGLSTVTIPLPLVGQILSFYVRMWDPSSGTFGAAIPVANVTECDVQIGSGLFRFQDTPEDNQVRLVRQHGIRMPEGVLAWDMARESDGTMTNANAINTLTTSGCQVTINFTGAQSSTAYYVLGYEALRYVALQ